MRIDFEQKLDFKDVLIRPKRSTLVSRQDVDLNRTFKFKNKSLTVMPIVASNMDTTGTFETAIELSKFNLITAIHKHYSVTDWIDFSQNNPQIIPWVCVSMGISDEDFYKTRQIMFLI